MAPYLLFCGTVLAAWLVRMVIGSLRILHSIGYSEVLPYASASAQGIYFLGISRATEPS